MGTREGVYNKCTDDDNILSITQISSESWIDLMFIEFSVMGLFDLVLFRLM